MALDSAGLFDEMLSHALSSGLFESVNAHEPKKAPGSGLTAALWVQQIIPDSEASGLDATTVVIVFYLRIFQNMLAEPQDAIDPAMLSAVDYMMNAYSTNFTLAGQVRNIDLLGSAGVPLGAQAGYINQDNRLYRVMNITVPLIINDVWSQEP